MRLRAPRGSSLASSEPEPARRIRRIPDVVRWFFAERRKLACHLSYLGDWSPNVTALEDLIAWMNVPPLSDDHYNFPGTCWACDQAWILAKTTMNGNWVNHPGLDREVVLTHAMQIAIALNPMAMAAAFGMQPKAIVTRLNAELIMDRLGGPLR